MKMLGFEEEDSIDTHNKWDDRIHPEDKINYLNEIQLHLDNKTPFYENSKRMLTKEEKYKWILSRGKVIEWDEIGNPVRLIGTHSDISGIMEKEGEMSKTLEIMSEQNSRLLNFAHIVSHNLSSHSGNFKMLLDIIEDEDNEQMIKDIFQHLKTSSSALNLTIDHLKELVDINSSLVHKKETLNVNFFLNRIFSILEEEIRINKVVIKNNVSNDVTILFNPSYLESILLNFTTNAIKYAHPDRYPEIIYTLAIEKNFTILEINDNGLGIDLEKHGDKLFGMYKTFHNNANARGIGLFITKNQIEAMGGKVEVESKVNIGTTFKIYFNNEF
jgi:signal transduction histidine kinase